MIVDHPPKFSSTFLFLGKEGAVTRIARVVIASIICSAGERLFSRVSLIESFGYVIPRSVMYRPLYPNGSYRERNLHAANLSTPSLQWFWFVLND